MFTLYGIPSCGTVKKARAFLEGKKLTHAFVDFRQNPPEPARVKRWVKAFGAAAMRNTSGGSYRALPEAKATWTDAEWTERFIKDPMLIKRPVVEHEGEPHSVGFRDPSVFK